MDAGKTAIFDMATSFQRSQVLYVIAKFRIADYLKDGPLSHTEIAEKVLKEKKGGEVLERVLRAAAVIGVLNRNSEDLKYSLNELSEQLIDGPGSMRYLVLHVAERATLKCWLELDKCIENGEDHNVAQEVLGKGLFQYYHDNPESQHSFNQAMTFTSTWWNTGEALSKVYDFKNVRKLVDVGGGHGALVAQMLRANANIEEGIVFDLSYVISDQTKIEYEEQVKSRLKFVGGSFFERVPEGGDVYLLKFIIHDWNDAKAIEILKTIHKALPAHGKVLVLDHVIQELNDPFTLIDLQMQVLVGAKERTEMQFQYVFLQAGLKILNIIPLLPTPFYAVVGEKI